MLNLATVEEEGINGSKMLAILDLHDGDAVATSGDAEQVIQRDGKLYSHIVNPQFGRMLEINGSTCAQAVVVCSSCMVADALATVGDL
jgi:thiamine biosynthesis lipoprotein